MIKYLILFSLLASLVFSFSPEWVKEGLKVEYQIFTYNKDNPSSISSVSSVSFTVVSKVGQEIKIETRSPSTKTTPTGRPVNNATANSGEFWYEPSLLVNSYIGQNIDGWLISKIGEKINLAGKDWNVVYMTKTVGGFTKYRTVDKEKGLLLIENVTASNVVYDTRFSSITPPFESVAPPTQPPPPSTQPPAATPPPTAPPPVNPGETPVPPPATAPPATVPPAAPVATAPAGSLQPPDSNVPCCPIAFIFLALGGFVYYHKEIKKKN